MEQNWEPGIEQNMHVHLIYSKGATAIGTETDFAENNMY